MEYIFTLLSRKNNSMLLDYFLKHPTLEIYPQQLGKELDISRKSMFDALRAALDSDLLEVKDIGRTRQYRLKRDNPLVKQLKILCTIGSLTPLLEKIKDSGTEVYLFGSAARGEDTEKSDIDLLLIGDQPKNDIIGKLSVKESIKPIYMTHIEYSGLARKDKPFYERMERDKIRLM